MPLRAIQTVKKIQRTKKGTECPSQDSTNDRYKEEQSIQGNQNFAFQWLVQDLSNHETFFRERKNPPMKNTKQELPYNSLISQIPASDNKVEQVIKDFSHLKIGINLVTMDIPWS